MSVPNLNSNQYLAVNYNGSSLLVFAGAGSGKTRVLTHRIARLIREQGIHPEAILAVTFTNKAAGEMKARISSILEGRSSPSWISTFHSFGARFLRLHGELLDYKKNFVIYDSTDSLSTLKRIYKRLQIDPKRLEPKSMLYHIDKAKNGFVCPEELQHFISLPDSISQLAGEIYSEYQQELIRSNAMDFGDLLFNTVSLFRLEKTIKERYREKFQHILIDEYQDTNKVQYLLVKELTGEDNSICAVGDDDQSIYAFRGASVQNILNFQQDFPDTELVTLDHNYRSSGNILNLANSIIENNKDRYPKKMVTGNGLGEPVCAYRGYDERKEAEFIVREISRLQIELNDIAVFYRTNAQSRALEEAFMEAGINFQIYGSLRFYERKEIKDVIGYLRLALNADDNEAFLRIINTPARGLGTTSINALAKYCYEKKLTLLQGLISGLEFGAPFLTKSNTSKFKSFLGILRAIATELALTTKKVEDESIVDFEKIEAMRDLISFVCEKSGYLGKLKKDATTEAENRIENLVELQAVAAQFASTALEDGRDIKITDFIERATLSSDLDKNTSDSSVSMMTLHLAKGLEFNTVFLTGLEQGLLPHVRSLENNAEYEEERRLFYVGVTRARERLYLTRSSFRNSLARSYWYTGQASDFLYDADREAIEDMGEGFLDF